MLVQSLSDGVSDSAAGAAANDSNLLAHAFDVCGNTQGADEVMQAIAFVQLVQSQCGSTDLLEDDSDCALLLIGVGNGQRYSFTFGIDSEDDKLASLSLLGDQGGVYFDQSDVGLQRFLQNNLIFLVVHL